MLRNLTPALESAVLRDMESWEFKPATRDGAPVDIDIVLEIRLAFRHGGAKL